MSEVRVDPVCGRRIILAAERLARPNDFLGLHTQARNFCPFCRGNEDSTPRSLYAFNDASGKWLIRVVPNKFPAFSRDCPEGRLTGGLYESYGGYGMHEVVIETPDHSGRFETLPEWHAAEIIRTYAGRARFLLAQKGIEFVMTFRNYGCNAGASLSHPHSQIVAMTQLPMRVRQEMDGAASYFSKTGRCVFCDMAKTELSEGKRLVAENAAFAAFTPYASRFSFELCLVPKMHASRFEDISASDAALLAALLQDILRKLYYSLDGVSYNMVIHTLPRSRGGEASYHWHMEIFPKITKAAGFEWGTGVYINTVSPERAAGILRTGQRFSI